MGLLRLLLSTLTDLVFGKEEEFPEGYRGTSWTSGQDSN